MARKWTLRDIASSLSRDGQSRCLTRVRGRTHDASWGRREPDECGL